MIEQKGTGALHGVKLASCILLLYSLHWLLAACGAAQSVATPLPATNAVPGAHLLGNCRCDLPSLKGNTRCLILSC